jgi:hypothetical protein
MNPRFTDITVTPQDNHLVFNGFRYRHSGGIISDLTVLDGVLEGVKPRIFAFVPTKQAGIVCEVSIKVTTRFYY